MLNPHPGFYNLSEIEPGTRLNPYTLAPTTSNPFCWDYATGMVVEVQDSWGEWHEVVVFGFRDRHSGVMYFGVGDNDYGELDLAAPKNHERIRQREAR